MRKEIETITDVEQLVHHFYARIQKDDLIGPIFNERLAGRWPQHLAKMVRFWQTVLLRERTYRGHPFKPHAHLPVAGKHFNRWLSLWEQTLTDEFIGENVHIAWRQAQQMAKMFQMKIEYDRQFIS